MKPPLPTAGEEEARLPLWGWEEEKEVGFLALGVLLDLMRLGMSVAESQRPKRGPGKRIISVSEGFWAWLGVVEVAGCCKNWMRTVVGGEQEKKVQARELTHDWKTGCDDADAGLDGAPDENAGETQGGVEMSGGNEFDDADYGNGADA